MNLALYIMRFFACLCSCFRKTKDTPENSVPQPNPDPNPAPAEPLPMQTLKIIVESKFQLSDVQMKDFTPATTEKQTLPYNCPICLRFFSTILTLKCCKQYICHYCIADLSREVQFEIACPHCKASPIYATDVDLTLSVKRYSDSPYGTFKQSVRPGNKWVPLQVVEEDKDFDELPAFPDSVNMGAVNDSQDATRLRLTV